MKQGLAPGLLACEDALAGADEAHASGRLGAGTGATVGGIRGPEHSSPGGLGQSADFGWTGPSPLLLS